MIQTKYGTFDGNSWEELCQRVFKLKYGDDNYQEMPASPGDYGIEGVILNTGVAFQCYCPDEHYTLKELYEKQRDKITKDLKKLKDYQTQIASRIGDVKIQEWIFLTPEIHHNDLLQHARQKQKDIRALSLPILDSTFSVVLKDADFYAQEINQVQSLSGKKIQFLDASPIIYPVTSEEKSDFEKNISFKNAKRCQVDGILNEKQHIKLNELTVRKWLEGESLIKKIEKDAAEIYFNIVKVINQYEYEVEELSTMWTGYPEELIQKVKTELANRLAESIDTLGRSEVYKIADHMTSLWLGLCPLDVNQ